ncbi:MAG: hypothetical protein RJA70_970 [Pseudomonadota bacterium]|jgi:serine/threonine protein kinase/tetratricopeptide (TPR) repeat protein
MPQGTQSSIHQVDGDAPPKDGDAPLRANAPAVEATQAPSDIDTFDSTSDSLANASTPKVRKDNIQTGHIIAQRYEVVSVLGEGGMGIVYRCRDRNTGTQIALKRVIPPDGRMADDYVTWFYKEARALAALSHPNIVAAKDFGQLPDGSPFLVMELVRGLSLHDYSNARLSFPIIWSLIDQVLSALAQAHARGVIHGDLKPSNVIVEEARDRPPKVHILDFGLAWLKRDPHDERLDGEKAMTFQPHAGAGTPGYMAPEQIMHEKHHVCGATDLYSLGCVLYKLLSGRAPFTGDPKELLKAHAYEEPPPLKPAVKVPDGVRRFVMRCLRKRPWDRYEFAAEARRAWAEFAPDPNIDVRLWRFPRVAATPPAADPAQTEATAPDVPESFQKPPREKARGLLSIRPSPMVGRADVCRRLLEVCDQVASGQGEPHRLVILVGPAGVGKTRIAEWLQSTIHEQGTMVPLTARYRRMRGTNEGMLGAVAQYFNFESVDKATVERSLLARWKVKSGDQKMRTWVAGAAEWLRPSPSGTETAGPSGVRFTLDTLDIRRQVVRFTLRRISQGRPLLFLLDDLHNAAQTTLEGLLKIHETERDQPLVMVATVRAEDVQLGTSTAERLRRLREVLDGEVIEINPMDKETTCELLRASLPLDDDAVEEAARRSRGFPLFALQQLHAWAHAGDFQFVDGHYRVPAEVLAVRPKTTADLWESRLAALSGRHQEAAFAVATLGVDVRRAVLLALLEQLSIEPEEAIMSLQNAEVILPRDRERYSWPHALLQEHLLRKLSERPDSSRLFLAAAEALRSHPLASTRRIERQRVINLIYAGEAERAARVFFNFLKHSWNGARQPLATLADLDLFKGKLVGETQAIAQRWRADALRHVGRNEEAKHHAQQSLRILELKKSEEEVAHCKRLLGQLNSEQGNSDVGLDLVSEAWGTFQGLNNLLGMAQCELVEGQIQMLLGRYDRAREVATRGEVHFAELDQPLGRGQCLLLLGSVAHADGATAQARQLTHEARGEFERAGYQLGQAQTSASLAHLEHRLNNFHAAEASATEALAAFEALKTVRGQSACERLLAMLALSVDDLESGELHAIRAETLYAQMGDPWGTVESRLLRVQLALARHNIEQAKSAIMLARELPVREPEPRQHYLLTRAWYQFEAGDFEGAQESLTAAQSVFTRAWQVGDHTPHLLARLSRFQWPSPETAEGIRGWRRVINEHARRSVEPS